MIIFVPLEKNIQFIWHPETQQERPTSTNSRLRNVTNTVNVKYIIVIIISEHVSFVT